MLTCMKCNKFRGWTNLNSESSLFFWNTLVCIASHLKSCFILKSNMMKEKYWINKSFNKESKVLIYPSSRRLYKARKPKLEDFQLRCAFTMRDKIASKLFSTLNYTSKCIMLSHYMRLSYPHLYYTWKILVKRGIFPLLLPEQQQVRLWD